VNTEDKRDSFAPGPWHYALAVSIMWLPIGVGIAAVYALAPKYLIWGVYVGIAWAFQLGMYYGRRTK